MMQLCCYFVLCSHIVLSLFLSSYIRVLRYIVRRSAAETNNVDDVLYMLLIMMLCAWLVMNDLECACHCDESQMN